MVAHETQARQCSNAKPSHENEYVYRRRLEPTELLPAIGVGVGVGAIAFYIAYLFLQRTPLDPKHASCGRAEPSG